MDSFNRLAAHLASISPQPYRRGTPDIRVEDHGSIVLLRPATTAGREWLEAHCDQSGYQPFSGGTLLCEPRYVANIVRRAIPGRSSRARSSDGTVILSGHPAAAHTA